MYLSPFIGVGIGFFIDSALNRMKNEKFRIPVSFLALTGITAVFCLVNAPSFKYVARPKITPALAGDFLKLQTITPKNSWIWTWWDYGYAIQYLAGRGVYHDGGSQYSPKTYFVATSFSTSEPAVAHNVILGISNIGVKGIDKLLKEGKKPEEIRNLIFSGAFSKSVNNPVYWVFTGDEIGKFAWINYFGTWNFDLKKGVKSPIYQLSNCRSLKSNLLVCGGLIIDLNKGEVLQNRRSIPLKELVIKIGNRLMEKEYHSKGLYFEIVKKGKKSHLFLMAEQPYKSMFNQMYILRNFDKKYFELVYDDFPTMVLYRVRNE
jgi:dolichyl-diphosphooligosaccharide--protein glycosyltransferase